MQKPKMHLKRPFSPAAPHTRVTYCGENIGSVKRYAITAIPDYDITCKRCRNAARLKPLAGQ